MIMIYCPECGEPHLKKERVKTFSRDEGGDIRVAVIELRTGSVLVNAEPDLFALSPSADGGHAVVVTFSCQTCEFSDDMEFKSFEDGTTMCWGDGEHII
jgi:hypothetical protein